MTMPGHYIVGGGQYYQHGANGKVFCSFVSAQGSLLEYNLLPIVLIDELGGSHRFATSQDFQNPEHWKNLGHPLLDSLLQTPTVKMARS